jgi:predicted PurR-regulated permease PerM
LVPIGFIIATATAEGISLIDRLQLGEVRGRLDQLRREYHLEIPSERDVRHVEVTLAAWRNKLQAGEPLDVRPAQVQNLLDRITTIAAALPTEEPQPVLETNLENLRRELDRLRDSEPGSVERDEALWQAEAEFREFKRNLLGGTYRALLTEWANPTEDQVEQMRRSLLLITRPLLSFGTDTLAVLLKLGFGVLIMVVALFFLLAEGSRMLDALIELSPLEEQYVRELAADFDRTCRAIVSATLISALVQGILAGIGFYVCGLRTSVALLTLLTMVLALVPFTGAAAVWVPVSLYLYFYQGSTVAAVGLAAYGFFVISSADNVIKPLVLHGQSNLHPLLALLSVIGGIQALGPIGIVVGPMVVVFLQTLLKILQRELMSMDRSQWTFWRTMGGPPADITPQAAATAAAAATTATAPTEPVPAAAGNGEPKLPAGPPSANPAKPA